MTKHGVLINVSHFPSYSWTKDEMDAAKEMAEEIQDIDFPRRVNESLTSEDLKQVALNLRKKIDEVAAPYQDPAVLVGGEKGIEFHLIENLKKDGYAVYYVVAKPSKKFKFSRFRRLI